MSSIHAQQISQEAEILGESSSDERNHRGSTKPRTLNRVETFVLRCLAILAVATPLFRGGNTELVVALLCVLLFAVAGVVAANVGTPSGFTGSLGRLGKRFAIIGGFFILLASLQLVPLPIGVVKFFSSSAGKLYSEVGASFGHLSVDFYATLNSSLYLIALVSVVLVVPLFGSYEVVTRVASFRRARRKRTRNEVYEQASRIDFVVDFVQRAIVFTGLVCALISLAHLTLNIKLLFGLFGADMLFAINPQRAHWPFVNPNHLAALLEISLMTAFARFLRMNLLSRFSKRGHRREGASLSLLRNPERIGAQAFRLISILVMFLALMLTLSRTGVVLSVVGLLVLWMWYAKAADALDKKVHGRWSERGGGLSMIANKIWASRRLIAVVLSMFVILFFLGQSGRERLANRIEYGLTHTHDEARVELAKASAEVIKDFPLFGSGLGTWKLSVAKYIPESLAAWELDYAHNDYMQFGAEAGLLGLAGLLFAALFAIAALRRKWREELLSSERILLLGAITAVCLPMIHALVDFHFHIPAVALSFCLALGVVVRLSRGTSRVHPECRGTSRVNSPETA